LSIIRLIAAYQSLTTAGEVAVGLRLEVGGDVIAIGKRVALRGESRTQDLSELGSQEET